MEEVIKYYVWKGDERFSEIGFDNEDEAIDYAKENDCDVVEKTIWSSDESYNNYEPAIEFKEVWKK